MAYQLMIDSSENNVFADLQPYELLNDGVLFSWTQEDTACVPLLDMIVAF
jgi:hypothetical protein